MRGEACGAGARERIEHQVVVLRERLDQRCEDVGGFLCRMQLVAGVSPVQYVGRGSGWKGRTALDQPIRAFVAVLQEADFDA